MDVLGCWKAFWALGSEDEQLLDSNASLAPDCFLRAWDCGRTRAIGDYVMSRRCTRCSCCCDRTRLCVCSAPRAQGIITFPTSTEPLFCSALAWETHDCTVTDEQTHEALGITCLRALTLTKEAEGNVAKSDGTRAPGCCETTCCDTSAWDTNTPSNTIRTNGMWCHQNTRRHTDLQFIQRVAQRLQSGRLFQQLRARTRCKTHRYYTFICMYIKRPSVWGQKEFVFSKFISFLSLKNIFLSSIWKPVPSNNSYPKKRKSFFSH